MSEARFKALMDDIGTELTAEEMAEGWHFCLEFDGLLVNSTDKKSEGQFCSRSCGATIL